MMGDGAENGKKQNLIRQGKRLAGEEEPMARLTQAEGDYCRDVCGCANICKRLKEGFAPCKDALRYERLRRYENTGWEPEEIMGKEEKV